jgi:phosphatidylserine synthase
MVAFGVAPALLAFGWALGDMGKVGWMVAFIYVAGAALRLARFNTQVGTADKRYFIGLASPAAAGVVAGVVWAFSDYGIQGSKMSFLVALLVAAAGMLMVSNIKYNSSLQSWPWCWCLPWSSVIRHVFCCWYSSRTPLLARCNICCVCADAKCCLNLISPILRSLLVHLPPILRSRHADQDPQVVRLP